MRTVTATVAEVRPETADAVTLRLDLGGAEFPYRPGQYVQFDPHQFGGLAAALRERVAKRGARESTAFYSLSSDGTDARVLEITIKLGRPDVAPSLVSHYLVRQTKRGDTLVLSGPAGRYCLPESPPAGIEGFLHVCAGSGVAPNRGMIRHALLRGWPQRQILVLQNRTEGDILFREEWKDLRGRYPSQFRVRHLFSVPAGEYATADVVRAEMQGFLDGARALAFVCGPNNTRGGQPGFCDLWAGPKGDGTGLLATLGIPPGRVLIERG